MTYFACTALTLPMHMQADDSGAINRSRRTENGEPRLATKGLCRKTASNRGGRPDEKEDGADVAEREDAATGCSCLVRVSRQFTRAIGAIIPPSGQTSHGVAGEDRLTSSSS